MSLLLSIIVLGILGFLSGVLGGIIGFGTTILLVPPLIYFYGPVATIPVIAIIAIIANVSRIFLWWHEIRWKVCFVYGLPSIPGVFLGANTLVSLNEKFLEVLLGVFILCLIPIRRWMRAQKFYLRLWHMSILGLCIGFLTGIVATTGALSTPFFLAFGLSKGAFLGTEAAGSLGISITKSIVFHRLGVVDQTIMMQGVLIGLVVLIGSYFSKKIVLRLPEKSFTQLMELVMLVSGITIITMSVFTIKASL